MLTPDADPREPNVGTPKMSRYLEAYQSQPEQTPHSATPETSYQETHKNARDTQSMRQKGKLSCRESHSVTPSPSSEEASQKNMRNMTSETPRPGPASDPTQESTHESFHGSLLNFPAEGAEQPPSSYRGNGQAGDENDERGEGEDPTEDPAGNKN